MRTTHRCRPARARSAQAQRASPARPAWRDRSRPEPDRQLRRPRSHPRRRFPDPDRTREGDHPCL